MRNAGGYLIGFGDGPVIEFDTFTCSHCQRVTKVPVKCRPEDLGGHCRSCDKPICVGCAKAMAAGGNCVPWEEAMLRMEARGAALRSYGI